MTLWTAVHQASLSFIISRSLLKLISIESVMPSNHLILCCPLLPLPSNFPISKSFLMSHLFSSGDQNIGASASATVLLMSIQDWFPLGLTCLISLSLLQHHNSRASVLCHSAFFMDQFSHPYMTSGRTIALTIWTFVHKVMSLLFNMLSRFVIAFLLRSKSLLILWLQSLLPIILEPEKIKSVILEHKKRSLRHGLIILQPFIMKHCDIECDMWKTIVL